jgi:hypothetical protein
MRGGRGGMGGGRARGGNVRRLWRFVHAHTARRALFVTWRPRRSHATSRDVKASSVGTIADAQIRDSKTTSSPRPKTRQRMWTRWTMSGGGGLPRENK